MKNKDYGKKVRFAKIGMDGVKRLGFGKMLNNDWALAKAAWKPFDFSRNFSADFANALLLAGGIFSTKL